MKTGKIKSLTDDNNQHHLHYQIWGDGNPHTLVCVHGLTGNSDDFKFMGEKLASHNIRVVAIDMAGRGKSDYFSNSNDYNFNQYLKDLNLLLKEIGCAAPASCDWLGVSMGGLLGFRLAGIENSPIHKLILSDIGPEVPQADLDFIAKVIKLTPEYNAPSDAIPILKMSIGTPYSRGPLTEEQWAYLAQTALKRREDGKYIRNFDPHIVHKFETEPLGAEDLWAYWKRTYQATLLLRGELSTLLPLSIVEKMKSRKPNQDFTIETITGAGHVPSLFPDDQIDIIANYLV